MGLQAFVLIIEIFVWWLDTLSTLRFAQGITGNKSDYEVAIPVMSFFHIITFLVQKRMLYTCRDTVIRMTFCNAQ